MKDYQELIKEHYSKVWKNEPNICYWDKDPAKGLPFNFRILEFPPTKTRNMWTYTTCCMSQEEDTSKIELHLFSSKQDEFLVELLTATAYYHRTGQSLNLNHTINFGKSWQDNSECTFGFISLPYLDGPDLEDMLHLGKTIKFYWLIPITLDELNFKKLNGADALEEQFESSIFNFIDSKRKSMV